MTILLCPGIYLRCSFSFYLVFNELLIFRANLQDQYFTDRQDRYLHARVCPDLVSYYSNLVGVISELSFHLNSNGDVVFPEGLPRPDVQPDLWKSQARSKLLTFLENEKAATLTSTEQVPSSTWIFPTVQAGPLGIMQDSDITKHILDVYPNGALPDMTLTSPYFNLTSEYQKSLLDTHTKISESSSHEKDIPGTKIIVAAPSASGFYGSKGLSYWIPALYSKSLQNFVSRVTALFANKKTNITFLEYDRKHWTFHAKGLWLFGKSEDVMLTLIGSPNLSNRSVYKDLESQFLLVTRDPALIHQFQKEREEIMSDGKTPNASSWTEKDRQLPFHVSTLYNLIGKKIHVILIK
eukprot:TRINITY_DN2887_c0_g1_i2.p1 TRINITY_DN2887_c0_g1~~TRINITY_DN2887_c0_g1_i2.p1  ORF type:complete len:352 (-),score=56.92 TRINITY_DN2887_c0_g1_i2:25-1080(-)